MDEVPVTVPRILTVGVAIEAATTPSDDDTAVFALELRPDQEPHVVSDAMEAALVNFGARVTPLSEIEFQLLALELPGRTFLTGDPAAAFAAGYALADEFDLAAAEPDLPTALYPHELPTNPDAPFLEEGLGGFPPGCWQPEERSLDGRTRWALETMFVPEAWAFSEAAGRPSRGQGIVVAQPDTGITVHSELDGVVSVAGFDILDDDPDPTDPLQDGNVGHGTATASVVVSPPAGLMTGSAPSAQHMPIRAIESVIRIRQVTVARSIDWAVNHGAHVVTMSLGGIPSFALHRALRRAVQADVIVLAAAGNCVRTVVWPARYDECIAVAGTNAADGLWPGTCRGAAVDVSAPAQNVFTAAVWRGGRPAAVPVRQGQGTSFAVALTAGVVALWLAHHGRANLVAAAHAGGESLQDMLRRLLRESARRPANWDAFEMGGGIVDARALLAADLDLGRDRESAAGADEALPRADRSVASLVAELAGPEAAVDDGLDWHRYGPEIASKLLQEQMAGEQPGEFSPESPEAGVSESLAEAVGNPALRDRLGIDSDMQLEVGVVRNEP